MKCLQNDHVRVNVAPQHGFVIASIELSDSTENILWNPPNSSLDALPSDDLGPSGDPSIQYFDREILAGGWFPMFPTAGLPGSDTERWMHGELPRLRWNVVEESDTHITAVVDTPATSFNVQRTVRLIGDTISAATRVRNHSGRTQQVTFGEHPCFSRKVFAHGVLEAAPRTVRVTSPADLINARLVGDREFCWPNGLMTTGETVDLSVIPGAPDGRHDHISLSGIKKATIRGRRHTVDLEWDLPHALLWQNFGNLDVFALEPMSAPGRTFDDAVAADAVTTLRDKQTLQTWMSLRVRTAR